MHITYRTNYPLETSAVVELFDNSGIRRPTAEIDRIQKMLEHANLTITAWDGDSLVGIGRALTDFTFCCYLSDLAVAKSYQKQGIGRGIIDELKKVLGPEVMILLLSAPEAMSYYPHIGLSAVDNGWTVKGNT